MRFRGVSGRRKAAARRNQTPRGGGIPMPKNRLALKIVEHYRQKSQIVKGPRSRQTTRGSQWSGGASRASRNLDSSEGKSASRSEKKMPSPTATTNLRNAGRSDGEEGFFTPAGALQGDPSHEKNINSVQGKLKAANLRSGYRRGFPNTPPQSNFHLLKGCRGLKTAR